MMMMFRPPPPPSARRLCAACVGSARRRDQPRSGRRPGGDGGGACARRQYHRGQRHHRPEDLREQAAPTPSFLSAPRHHAGSRSLHAHSVPPASMSTLAGGAAPKVSEAQRRSAQLELDRMNKSTVRLIDAMSTKDDGASALSEAFVNEVRVALHYWSRRWYMHFHPGFGRAAKGSALSLDALRRWDGDANNDGGGFGPGGVDAVDASHSWDGDSSSDPSLGARNMAGDHGARQAERLLDLAVSCGLVPRGLFQYPDDVSRMRGDEREREEQLAAVSPNLTFANIVETYLLPTAYGGAGAGADDDQSSGGNYARLSKHFAVTPSYVRAVADATRVMEKMKRVQSRYPGDICSDSLGVKTELNVWAKRRIVLEGADGAEVLRELELQDASTKLEARGEDAYTVRGCLDEMESILSRAEEAYVSTGDERLRPSWDWYNHILGALTRHGDVEEAIGRAKEIVRGMEEFRAGSVGAGGGFGGFEPVVGDSAGAVAVRKCHSRPNIVTYNSLLYCLARGAGSGGSKGAGIERAREAGEVLRRLKYSYRLTRDVDVRPDEVTHGAVLHALAQAGMAEEAERILDEIEEEWDGDCDVSEGAATTVVPSLTIYNTVLNAWANHGGSGGRNSAAPSRAESLLERMKILAATGRNPGAAPDSVSVSTAIMCQARSRTRRGAERGERMLLDAVESYLKDGAARTKPDTIMFNCAILGWTSVSGLESERGGGQDAVPAERAEMLLERMRDDRLDVRPVAYTINLILDTWAKSKLKTGADRAVKLLRQMPSLGVAPDEVSYNSVLHAITKERDPKWLGCAEDLLQEMKDNNIPVGQVTYHVLMNIYGKNNDRNGAKKAEELLRSMDEANLHTNDISYNICIDAYARRGDHEKAESLLEEMIVLSERGREECKPTIHSFASVINALAKSGDKDAVSRAEAVIQKVERLDYVSPNSILYNSLIDCIVRSKRRDSASRAEEILMKIERMHRGGNPDMRPNSYGYSMVLTCCARSKDPGAAERAERILIDMERMYAEGHSDVVANSRCYSSAITAWARSASPNSVERAFALIDRMEQNGRDGSPHGKPNAHCYNALIHAIAKSQQPGKAKKCDEVLQRMLKAKEDGFYESAPNSITYSTIINACAFTNGDEEEKRVAFDLARTCFQTLLGSTEMDPSESTFTNFLLCICRHLSEGVVRDQFAEAVFHEGCRRGVIGSHALDTFRRASPAVADRILSQHGTHPAEWRRNIGSGGYE